MESDVITEKDAEMDVKQHLLQEQRIEKILGSRYISKIKDQEAGSTISTINEKNSEQVMMNQFFDEFNETITNKAAKE